jgi:lipopolysaccharide/colanic/teichoic acid biosynthesis glycosyltransferase
VKRSHRVYDTVKRAADVVAAAALLVLLSPVLLLTALAVRVTLGSPVLFRQVRPGRDGAPFTLVKFRTMREVDPTDGAVSPPAAGSPPRPVGDIAAVATDAERLTPLGRLLRSASLDELPELVNVLRGEMSIIGPRPLLAEYLDRYSPEQARRHEVRPGITGWAQVNGRNEVPWPERLAMDVWYVDNRSLALDLRILGMTLAALVSRRGVSAEGHATMDPFDPGAPTADEEDV